MDRGRIIAEFEKFIEMTDLVERPTRNQLGNPTTRKFSRGDVAEIQEHLYTVDTLLDRLLPAWREDVPPNTSYQYGQRREACRRAIGKLRRESEVDEMLGDNSPQMPASGFHPWVWDSAKALWNNGHYREAIQAAASMVSLETQKLTGDMKVSETNLMRKYLSPDVPTDAKPKLRHPSDDGSRSADSIREGMHQLAAGLYLALRNPASHGTQQLDESTALEQLAAFSLLARFLSECKLVTV